MIQAKQIAKYLSTYVRVDAASVSGGSFNATTPITTALSTAGDGGVSVPLQVLGGSNSIGVHTTTTYNNRVQIFSNATKVPLTDASGNEVYGRLTESSGTYTLTFYSLVAGTETAYSFGSSTSIDFEFLYRFDFNRLPANGLIAVLARNVSDDPSASGGSLYQEQLTVTTNGQTVFTLTKSPTSATRVIVSVNGIMYTPIGGSAPIAVSGAGNKTVTWSDVNAGFALATTDTFIASYMTSE